MRKMILLTGLILLSSHAYSQGKTADELLRKSKKNQTTAWVLAGIGTAAIITGLIIESPYRGTDQAQSYTGGFMEIGGTLFVISSIPYFIGAASKKKKAAKLTFNNPGIYPPARQSFIPKPFPSISLKIAI